tara:strand:- start:13870 stop:16518 length:2649 start_codon:yes stop_codon:yes gene_type:complete
MKSKKLRQHFISYFQNRKHQQVASSPIVIKDDPSLLFVNAGMNQFKDLFLGQKKVEYPRVVNSQKCLRVSGKHNDLEEVGLDTYHHTMFEMLGNWSFGDYFKRDAIFYAWDFLTRELGVDKDRLYITYFKGDENQKLQADLETKNIWSEIIDQSRIVEGNKKDNFWEMGQTGPCGPSTEIHIDLRLDDDRQKHPALSLINCDHPQVIEIWNIVFIEFNRLENKNLVSLPNKHVDTGMGFERLCMVLQNKKSTYDTDLFSNLINVLTKLSKFSYGKSSSIDVAFRVIVDHIRAIVFAIADGQKPSSNGAGYVIRRILRRAVRYGYTHLNLKEPFLYRLVNTLSEDFKDIYPEIFAQSNLITKIIEHEEKSFLRTLGKGLEQINNLVRQYEVKKTEIPGSDVFFLYDTYGFPPDLTNLILKEKGLCYNLDEFSTLMSEQKNRSRKSSEINLGDWIILNTETNQDFLGYSKKEILNVNLLRYRKVTHHGQNYFHLVFNKTPFYPEGGGQVGDTGYITNMHISDLDFILPVINTKKENNLIIHIVDANIFNIDLKNKENIGLHVDLKRRLSIQRNHSATHLLHNNLRLMFGNHIEQKGSFINSKYLRFDFSHHQKINDNELNSLEKNINQNITNALMLKEQINVPINEAKKMGAISLFGEKYTELVRVIQFGDSIELCGGTHVNNTSEIGWFKILSESSISSGIRRIEAVTSESAIKYANQQFNILGSLKNMLKNTDDLEKSVKLLVEENKQLRHLAESNKKNQITQSFNELNDKIIDNGNCKSLSAEINLDPASMKNICFKFLEKYDDIVILLLTTHAKKIIINVAVSKEMVKTKLLSANKILHLIATHINAKGGGQDFFVVASGSNYDGVPKLLKAFNKIVTSL